MSGGILSGPAIAEAIKNGDITVDPFEERHINPASIDLRLGPEVAVYSAWADEYHRFGENAADASVGLASLGTVLDVRDKPSVRKYVMDKERGWVVSPGILYLMHTQERVYTEKYVPVLDGKSSIGRLGLQVHLTAGYGDPGFNGVYTLEVLAVHPIRIFPGMRFCQMRFHTIVGEPISYDGHYQGKAAAGAVPSKAHEQFHEDLSRRK